jgi:hypothetical protein
MDHKSMGAPPLLAKRVHLLLGALTRNGIGDRVLDIAIKISWVFEEAKHNSCRLVRVIPDAYSTPPISGLFADTEWLHPPTPMALGGQS